MPGGPVAPLRLEADIAPLLRPLLDVSKRKSRRFLFPTQYPGLLVLPEESVSENVWLHDISESGISFCMTRPVNVGSEIIVIFNGEGERPVRWRATVVHPTRLGAGDWRIGCKFAVPITPEFLARMLANYDKRTTD